MYASPLCLRVELVFILNTVNTYNPGCSLPHFDSYRIKMEQILYLSTSLYLSVGKRRISNSRILIKFYCVDIREAWHMNKAYVLGASYWLGYISPIYKNMKQSAAIYQKASLYSYITYS